MGVFYKWCRVNPPQDIQVSTILKIDLEILWCQFASSIRKIISLVLYLKFGNRICSMVIDSSIKIALLYFFFNLKVSRDSKKKIQTYSGVFRILKTKDCLYYVKYPLWVRRNMTIYTQTNKKNDCQKLWFFFFFFFF